MKKWFFLLLLLAKPVSAMEWHVYVSSDPSDGRNTQEVAITTNTTQVLLPGSTLQCEVSPVKVEEVKPFAFETRMLGCDLPGESGVAIQASCLLNDDQFEFSYLYLYNNKHVYEMSMQCLGSKEKK